MIQQAAHFIGFWVSWAIGTILLIVVIVGVITAGIRATMWWLDDWSLKRWLRVKKYRWKIWRM